MVGDMEKKEYIAKVSGDWRLVDSHELVSGRIEVPEGAEILYFDKRYEPANHFFKTVDGKSYYKYLEKDSEWMKYSDNGLNKFKENIDNFRIMWQRSPTTLESRNTTIQEKLKSINKESEVKMKEYLDKEYRIRKVKQTSGDNFVPSGWIEIPEGAEEYRANHRFYKNNGNLFYATYGEWGEWVESGLPNFESLWKRNHATTLDSKNASTQDKLKFIEKWLNGEKIQYILGVESDKTQWHNFTEGAMQYIKRSDIKFREAPKYVTINGIEFKSVESLLKHVKKNFDLEDGENE